MIDPATGPETIRAYTVRGLVTLVLFSLSVLVALFSPTAARIVWVLIAIATPLAERWARRTATR